MADTASPAVKRSGRWVYLVAILVFFAYAAWIMGPYVRSVIVRDAAVTTWLNTATSPIDGTVEFQPLAVDRTVGTDGIIVHVRNDRLSRQELIKADIRADLTLARVKELQYFIEEIKLLERGRAELKAHYADTFRAELDAQITSLGREIKVTSDRLVLMRKIAARKAQLASKGLVSDIVADEEAMRVSSLELEIATLQKKLDQAQVRRAAADNGVFMSTDGNDPGWVSASRMELKLEKKRARLELKQAEAELKLARAAQKTAEEDFQRLSHGTVGAPPDSVVWSQRVARGATIQAGSPVAEWLDCSTLLIDVPVSDAEVSLIRPGMEAEVVLEGESGIRTASVLLTRGSASTLGVKDLAARAKGRHDGIAQVLLDFSHERDSFDVCPVGRAAFVEFPDVGLLDVIRARLRL